MSTDLLCASSPIHTLAALSGSKNRAWDSPFLENSSRTLQGTFGMWQPTPPRIKSSVAFKEFTSDDKPLSTAVGGSIRYRSGAATGMTPDRRQAFVESRNTLRPISNRNGKDAGRFHEDVGGVLLGTASMKLWYLNRSARGDNN